MIGKENRFKINAVQTGTILMVLTVVSKCVGIFRDVAFAKYFGTSPVADAYVLAFYISIILFTWIFAGIATAFVPLLAQEDAISEARGLAFARKASQVLFAISIVSSVVGIVFAKQLVYVFAHGWFIGEVQSEQIKYAEVFVRIGFSCALFNAAPGIWSSYLRYKKMFIFTASVAMISNFTVIFFIIIASKFSAYWLAGGYISGFMIMAVILGLMMKIKYGKKKRLKNYDGREAMRKLFLLGVPVFIGTAIEQVNTFVDAQLATWLPSGSPAALNYGAVLSNAIAGLFGAGILSMLYPKLAEAHAKGESGRYAFLFRGGLTSMMVFILPVSVIGLFFSETITQIVYERGEFNAWATDMAGKAFFCYSISVFFVVLMLFLVQIFYSMHDTKSPLVMSVITVVLNVSVSLLLIKKYQLVGVALGTSAAQIGGAIGLLILFVHKHREIVGSLREVFYKGVKILAAAVIAVAASKLAYVALYAAIAGSFPRTVLFICVAIVGAGLYLFLLWVFKVKELEFIKMLRGTK
jgi:putative peptidoglycan lipid II flippase